MLLILMRFHYLVRASSWGHLMGVLFLSRGDPHCLVGTVSLSRADLAVHLFPVYPPCAWLSLLFLVRAFTVVCLYCCVTLLIDSIHK